MACAGRVFNQLYTEVWPAISRTRAPGERLRARWEAFIVSFDDWAPMMDLVRGLAVGNAVFRAEYLRLTATIVAPIAREVSMLGGGRAQADAELLSYAVMGISEAAAPRRRRRQACLRERLALPGIGARGIAGVVRPLQDGT